MKYPDFIICKGGPSLFEDTIVTIVEVKKAADDADAYAQLSDYMVAAGRRAHVSPLLGFLILGTDVIVYRLGQRQGGTGFAVVEIGSVTIVEPAAVRSFLTMMKGIAEMSW